MTIAVYGASGYTGRLVAAELGRRNLDAVLVGRDRERLRGAAREAGVPGAEVRTAGTEDAGALAEALRGCDAVIACVAPFSQLGEPVVAAALAAGCQYVDTSGEQLYLRRVFDRFAGAAVRAGVTVVPGATDDGVPGDLIAHLTAQRVEGVQELTMAHRLRSGGMSRGSLRSALANRETFQNGGLAYDGGDWRPGGAARQPWFTFPDQAEPSRVERFPCPEVVTIPRHVPADHVEGVIEADVVARLGAVSRELVDGAPPGPAEEQRRSARFTLVADALGRDGRRARGVVEGCDLYGTTAVIAVEAARRLVAGGAAAGVRAPAEVYDPADFLDFLAPYGLRWTVGALEV